MFYALARSFKIKFEVLWYMEKYENTFAINVIRKM